MKPTTLSTVGLIDNHRKELRARYSLYLQLGTTVIKVLANRQVLIDALIDYYQQFVASAGPARITVSLHEAPCLDLPIEYTIKQPDPGKSKIKEEYVDLPDGRIVRKRLTGMVFVFGGGENAAIGPCLENLNQVVNFINNRHIEALLCDGCLLGHAAGVTLNGYGIALAGFSGAGKSTLALHLMSAGATFVSNDRLVVKEFGQGLLMNGVAKLPRINPGTALNNTDLASVLSAEERQQFEQMPVDELWDLEHKYDVFIDQCFGKERFVLQAPMHALVILNWRRNGQPARIEQVTPRERQDLLPAFMKSTGLFFYPDRACNAPEPTLDAYMDLLSLAKMVEISGGTDFETATRACIAMAQKSVSPARA